MAIGPGIYFDKYKDKSIEELEKLFKDLNSIKTNFSLYIFNITERRKRIDDNSVISNNSTKKEVIKLLINFKKKYPNYDIQNINYWEAKKMTSL